MAGSEAREDSLKRDRSKSRSKGVLVISVGLSPQVVTETVYALACERNEPIDEIHMWTTTGGAERIERELLRGGEGALYRLFADYGIHPPAVYVRVFGSSRHAPAGLRLAEDRPLEDIRSREDNQVVADTLMRFFQEQASDPSRRLLCSLAGARKTIGPYLALALQFFGRPGDQLFHVLVPPELEGNRAFFYPPPGSPPGLIELVEVPVALLREHFDVLKSVNGPLSYSELIHLVEEELAHLREPPKLEVRRKLRHPRTAGSQRAKGSQCLLEVAIGLSPLPLSGLQLALYTALIVRRVRCPDGCTGCPSCFVTMDEVLDAQLHEPLRRIVALGRFRDHRLETLARWSRETSSVDERVQAFRQTISKINRAVGRQPGRQPYRVVRRVCGEHVAYGIPLSPDRIAVSPKVANVWDP